MDYKTLASAETVSKAAEALKAHGFIPKLVGRGVEAFEFIKANIPQGASVMNGSSTTLQEIGFVEYLKAGAHGWNNLHAAVLAEKDTEKQNDMRKHSVVSDYYLGSVHALTEGGEMVIASQSGSQQPHLSYTSQNIILVVSTKKIVPDIHAAFERLDKHVVPLEDERMKKVYGPSAGSKRHKTLIMSGEAAFAGRSVHVVLVSEDLGF